MCGVEIGRHAGLTPFETLAGLELERFGFGVFFLACQTRAEEAHRIKSIARVRPALLRKTQAFAQKHLSFGVILLGKTDRAELSDDAGARRWIGVWFAPHGLQRQV